MSKILKMQNFYSQFINPGDIAYDVGANVGNRTNIFMRLKAKTVAVEPQEGCVKKLVRVFNAKDLFLYKTKTFPEGVHIYSNADESLKIIQAGLGEQETSVILKMTKASTIASMNEQWINAVKAKRFKNYYWKKETMVHILTLDQLIMFYGVPKFMKIDVEGYELKVLEGLHHRIKCVSFEYVPEIIHLALGCVDRLMFLSPDYVFNFSEYETMSLGLDEWVSADKIKSILAQTQGSFVYGDVYAKLP